MQEKVKGRNTCLLCGSKAYKVLNQGLVEGGEFYYRVLKCLNCGLALPVKAPLLGEEGDGYKLLYDPRAARLRPLSQLVWEWNNDMSLPRGRGVRHLNGHLWDNRPANLCALIDGECQAEDTPRGSLLECLRCGHRWIRRAQKVPGVCPKCKSPYWNSVKIRGPHDQANS